MFDVSRGTKRRAAALLYLREWHRCVLRETKLAKTYHTQNGFYSH